MVPQSHDEVSISNSKSKQQELNQVLALPSTIAMSNVTKGKRSVGSRVLTSDQMIQELSVQQEEARRSEEQKKIKAEERKRKAEEREKIRKEKMAKKEQGDKEKELQKQTKGKGIAKKRTKTVTEVQSEEDSDGENYACEGCNMPWFPQDEEPWVSCRACDGWFHEDCAQWGGDMNLFICSTCRD